MIILQIIQTIILKQSKELPHSFLSDYITLIFFRKNCTAQYIKRKNGNVKSSCLYLLFVGWVV